jgi:hypothetical protein
MASGMASTEGIRGTPPKEIPPENLNGGEDTGSGENRAAGTIDRPVWPGEVQMADLSEAGANLGGPVDVFPSGCGLRRKDRPA